MSFTEFRMYERFVQIEYQSLASSELRYLRLYHGVFLRYGLLSEPPSALQLEKLLLREHELSLYEHLVGLSSHLPLASTTLIILLVLLCLGLCLNASSICSSLVRVIAVALGRSISVLYDNLIVCGV